MRHLPHLCPPAWLRRPTALAGLVLLLAFAPASIVQAQSANTAKPEPYPAEQIIKGFQAQIDIIKQLQRAGKRLYASPKEGEYLAHFLSVMEKNIKTIGSRKTVSRKKVDAYAKAMMQYSIDLTRYSELKSLLTAWEKPGAGKFKAQSRQKMMATRNPLFAPGGRDPYEVFETIARESRPKPLKLETVTVVVAPNPVKVRGRWRATDYWASRTGEYRVTVKNTGEDDSEHAWMSVTTETPSITSATSTAMSCTDAGKGDYVDCNTTSLKSGETKQINVAVKLRPEQLKSLAPGNDFRAEVALNFNARSEEPQSEVHTAPHSFKVRACVPAYKHALQRPFQEFRNAVQTATKVAPGLPGQVLYNASSLDGELAALVAYIKINGGLDSDLKWMDLSYGPYAPVKTVALQLPETLIGRSRPGHTCSSPEAEVAELRRVVLWKLQRRFEDVGRHRLDLLLALRTRYNSYLRAMGAEPLEEEYESAREGAVQELVFQAIEKGLKAASARALARTGTAIAAREVTKITLLFRAAQGVSVFSTLLSTVTILKASGELYYLVPEYLNREDLLGLIEAAPYMTRLYQRYSVLTKALEKYLDAVEAAHRESCTCRAPFKT